MTDHDNNKPAAAIKVVDRRRFTPEGHARPGMQAAERPLPAAQAAEPSGAAPAAPTGASARQAQPRPTASEPSAQPAVARRPPAAAAADGDGDGDEAEPRLEFMPFIASLATTALAALGVLPEAQGGGMPRNPGVAREYIDVIVMLERRTRGNLTPEEAATLTQLVADLKLQYVEATRSVQPVRHMPTPGGFAQPGPGPLR